MSQYIGKTISLVSTSNIRYVGTLYDISSEKSSVSLTQVVIYGTEGRAEGQNEIPASARVFEFIVFKGSDVKDLQVVDAPPAQVQVQQIQAQQQAQMAYYMQAQPQQPQSQHPQSQQPQSQSQPQPQQPQPQQEQNVPAQAPPVPPTAAPKEKPEAANNPAAPASTPSKENVSVMMNRMSECQNAEQPRCLPSEHTNQPSTTDEFDFVSNNAKFDKRSARPDDEVDVDKAYNKKSSFFDNLTSNDREGNFRRQRESELNAETFGEAAADSYSAQRGRGRGRGGYRGRGRGDYRGGRGGRGGRGRGNYQGDDRAGREV